MTTNKAMSGFKRGSGCYVCGCCGKQTRSTGEGDAAGCQLCAECYEVSGWLNSVSDNGPRADLVQHLKKAAERCAKRRACPSCASEVVAALKPQREPDEEICRHGSQYRSCDECS